MTRFQKSTSYLLWIIHCSIRRSQYIHSLRILLKRTDKDFLVLFLPNKDCNASWFIEEIQILPMFYKHPVSPNAVRIKQSLCLKLTFQIQRVATAKQFQRSKTKWSYTWKIVHFFCILCPGRSLVELWYLAITFKP